VAIAELLAEVAELASTDQLRVEVDLPAGVDHVQADRAQLRRALINLATNAVQAATAAGQVGAGTVRLSARATDDGTALEVWNRGKEISPETSGKLFEPFFTTREKGTGLGLAFVREIAIDHGGKVELTSANGETTFAIVLPHAAG
jgi:signal transduction histidine kinase